MNLYDTGARPPQLLIPLDPLLGIHQKSSGHGAKPRLAALTGTEYHASVKRPLRTFTPGLPTFSLQFIDRALKYGPIRKKRLNKPLHLLYEQKQRLSEPTEFFSCRLSLYAHLFISIQFLIKNSRKK
jgi:hypothetical protein